MGAVGGGGLEGAVRTRVSTPQTLNQELLTAINPKLQTLNPPNPQPQTLKP